MLKGIKTRVQKKTIFTVSKALKVNIPTYGDKF